MVQKPISNFTFESFDEIKRDAREARALVRELYRNRLKRIQDDPRRWQRSFRIAYDIELTRRQSFLTSKIDMLDPFISSMIQSCNTENLKNEGSLA